MVVLSTKTFITQIIQVDEDRTYSKLHYYKRSPPDPKASDILDFIHRFEQLETADITKLNIEHVSPKIVEQLAKLTKCYEVRALRRIQPESKRYALLACFLTEASKTLLDHIIEMNEAMLQKKEQKSRCAFNNDFKRLRRKAKENLKRTREICNYPQSRVNENKAQGWLFLVGFSILGIIGIISIFS